MKDKGSAKSSGDQPRVSEKQLSQLSGKPDLQYRVQSVKSYDRGGAMRSQRGLKRT
jgi:hypothetical protein